MEKRKTDTVEGLMLVLAPHEGVIASDVWLQCRRKVIGNKCFQPARKAVQTWLAGKLKCGYALMAVNRYLDYMQKPGLISSLPLGLNQIPIQRGLATSGTAVFIPFVTRKIFKAAKPCITGATPFPAI